MIILGIIPARGGSKGIPRKNIKPLCGKPLIAYTVESAISSGIFHRIILTTDSEEIASVGKQFGAEVPFLRPPELAEDNTPTLPVILHTLKWLKEKEGFVPDHTVILQPTTPLRQGFHLKEAIDLLIKSEADSVVSVSEVPGHYNPHWQFKLDLKNRLKIFTGESLQNIVKRRQDLLKTYTRNGAIYAFKTKLLFEATPSFYGNDVCAYIMEGKYSVNIDSMEDFKMAEIKMAEIKNNKVL